MQASSSAYKRAQQLAASADPARNDNAAERDNAATLLRAHCEKHGLDVYAFAPFLRPEPEAAEQPAPEAADGSERAKRQASVRDTLRAVRGVYTGPSPGFRLSGSFVSHDEYAVYTGELDAPGHKAAKCTARDGSALLGIILRGDGAGGFDPSALCIDCGVYSRLASLGFLGFDGKAFALTARGLEAANNVANNRKPEAA